MSERHSSKWRLGCQLPSIETERCSSLDQELSCSLTSETHTHTHTHTLHSAWVLDSQMLTWATIGWFVSFIFIILQRILKMLLLSYCVCERVAPYLDETHVPCLCISSGYTANDRLIQTERERHMYKERERNKERWELRWKWNKKLLRHLAAILVVIGS